MKTIPEIRERLHEIADSIRGFHAPEAAELHELAEETKRRSPVRCAKKRIAPMTDTQVAELKAYAAQMPDASYHELSQALGHNTGRISEVLAGKRA